MDEKRTSLRAGDGEGDDGTEVEGSSKWQKLNIEEDMDCEYITAFYSSGPPSEARYDYPRVSSTHKSAQDLGYEGIWPKAAAADAVTRDCEAVKAHILSAGGAELTVKAFTMPLIVIAIIVGGVLVGRRERPFFLVDSSDVIPRLEVCVLNLSEGFDPHELSACCEWTSGPLSGGVTPSVDATAATAVCPSWV